MQIITRKEAIAQGLNRFFTGKPCKHGHIAEKYVYNWRCLGCTNAANVAYYEKNRESQIKKSIQWGANNKERINKRNKERYNNDLAYKERVLARCALEYQKNIEAGRASRRAYGKANRAKLSAYHLGLYHNDPQYRAGVLLRGRITRVLANSQSKKSSSTFDLLGTSKAGLIAHLEAQFQSGMTWENQGQWHIDHIRPCASFDLTDPEQQKVCFHYTNLQPLWAKDNLSKNDRLDWVPAEA